MDIKLIRPLPPGRTYEQVKNHYLVEKSISQRLMKSNAEERKVIFATMYDELFRLVPDHPRLTRRDSEQLSKKVNKEKFNIIKRFINESNLFVEFAPGDCKFAFYVAKFVKKVIGIDISDQRNSTDDNPGNFKLIVYDGYNLDEIENNSVDIVFSDQLIEHFHPEDTESHFRLVHRILKVGGKYIFRTPHFLTGPHDISKFFCDKAEGFHLKEWTYIEIKKMIIKLKYSKFLTYFKAKGIMFRIPYYYFVLVERFFGLFPVRRFQKIKKIFIPTLLGIAVK